MKKYPYCTSTDFKRDIKELCENCPLPKLISKQLKIQVIPQAETQREILPQNDFEDYLRGEISRSQERMREQELVELQNKDYKKDKYRAKRIEIYLWNKEQIKVLVKYLNEQNSQKSKIKHIAIAHKILVHKGVYPEFELLDSESNGDWKATEMIRNAKKLYNLQRGQQFYKTYKTLDIRNYSVDWLKQEVGYDYKSKLINATNYGEEVKEFIDELI